MESCSTRPSCPIPTIIHPAIKKVNRLYLYTTLNDYMPKYAKPIKILPRFIPNNTNMTDCAYKSAIKEFFSLQLWQQSWPLSYLMDSVLYNLSSTHFSLRVRQ